MSKKVIILILLGEELGRYISFAMFSFPRHLLTVIFCIATLIIYPLAIFSKKSRIVGVTISSLIIITMIIFNILKPPVYSTDILADGEKYQFNDQYKVYLLNSKLGDLNIKYEQGIETWMVHAEFKHSGKTEFILESPSGEKRIFEITIKRDTYIINEKNT